MSSSSQPQELIAHGRQWANSRERDIDWEARDGKDGSRPRTDGAEESSDGELVMATKINDFG
jgi:hypothetical protein